MPVTAKLWVQNGTLVAKNGTLCLAEECPCDDAGLPCPCCNAGTSPRVMKVTFAGVTDGPFVAKVGAAWWNQTHLWSQDSDDPCSWLCSDCVDPEPPNFEWSSGMVSITCGEGWLKIKVTVLDTCYPPGVSAGGAVFEKIIYGEETVDCRQLGNIPLLRTIKCPDEEPDCEATVLFDSATCVLSG